LNPYRISSYKALNLARLPIPPLPQVSTNFSCISGADGRSRTGDPFLTMEVLCLLSYIGFLDKNGAVDETRTRNLRDGNAMLYQLSYYRIWWAKQGSNL
jgi:hypothetical protein